MRKIFLINNTLDIRFKSANRRSDKIPVFSVLRSSAHRKTVSTASEGEIIFTRVDN